MLEESNVNAKLIAQTLNYRKIQIMLIIYRNVYSRFMLAIIVTSILFLETSCLYNCVDSARKGVSIFAGLNLLYFWCGCAFALNVLFIFGKLADIHQTSRELQLARKSKTEFAKNKWFRRWMRSCPVLKVYLGGTNFLEAQTPLLMESFVIIQAVNLLLLR